MSVKINPGFGVNLLSFHDSDQKYRDVLKFLEKNKLNKFLSARSKIFNTELTEFHNTANLLEEGIIKGVVRGTEVTISADLIADVFEFDKNVEEDVLTDEDLGMALTAMHFTGLNPNNVKKSEVADEFRFLAEIIGKVIFCKTSCSEAISRKMLRVMAYVVLKKKMDWGKLIFELLQTKMVLNVIPYGRILSVIISTTYPSICLSKGIPFPLGKRISSSLFSKWNTKVSKTKPITTKGHPFTFGKNLSSALFSKWNRKISKTKPITCNEPSFAPQSSQPIHPTSFLVSSTILSDVLQKEFRALSDSVGAKIDSLSLQLKSEIESLSRQLTSQFDSLSRKLTSHYDSLERKISEVGASVDLLSETLAHSSASLIAEIRRSENYANFPNRQSGSRGDTCSCGSYDYSRKEESEEYDFRKFVETVLDTAANDKTASNEGIVLSETENLETTKTVEKMGIMDTKNDEDAAESKVVTDLVFSSEGVQKFSQGEIVPDQIAEKTSEKLKEDYVYTENEDILLKNTAHTACFQREKTDASSTTFPESQRRSNRLKKKYEASQKKIDSTGNEFITALKMGRMRDELLNPQGKRFRNVDAYKAKTLEALAVQASDHKGKGPGSYKDIHIKYKRSKLEGPIFAKPGEVLIAHNGVPPVLPGSEQKINILKKSAKKLKQEE